MNTRLTNDYMECNDAEVYFNGELITEMIEEEQYQIQSNNDGKTQYYDCASNEEANLTTQILDDFHKNIEFTKNRRTRNASKITLSKKKKSRIQPHVVYKNCPGWVRYGWECICGGRYTIDKDNGHFVPNFTCVKCQDNNGLTKCGCHHMMTQRSFVGKRISVYWHSTRTWYPGTVLCVSRDEGTHDILYDDEKDKPPISEKLFGEDREKWYLL